MHDLTSLLTTIAGSSATLAAIIGGFIASRLIALNTERAELMIRIGEIEKEMSLKSRQVAEARSELVEDYAVNFIKYRIDDVIDGRPLDLVFLDEDRPEVSKEELLPFWNKALELSRSLHDAILATKTLEMPREFAGKLADYEYEICKAAIDEWKERQDLQSETFPYYIGRGLNKTFYRTYLDANVWRQKKKEEINIDLARLEWLETQKQQLESRREALLKPRGVIEGLIVFVIVAAEGIIVPLMSVPLLVEDGTTLAAKRWYLGGFSILLLLVFGYFIRLFKWKDAESREYRSKSLPSD